MKSKLLFALILMIFTTSITSCKAQKTFGENNLQMIKSISLPGVKGRIDHMCVNVKDQIVYIAALGNNSVEVVDIVSGKVIHSIKGFDEPQGLAYIAETSELFIANGGNGLCYFYDAKTFEKKATINLSTDADNVRYDSAEKKIYVGYGSGGIAIISTIQHSLLTKIILPAHPEGFQIEHTTQRLFVNLTSINTVAVVDIKKGLIEKRWRRSTPTGNFPIALTTTGSKLFVGFRHPAKLAIINPYSGHLDFITDLGNDVDDVFYDDNNKRIYASCGGGYTRLGFVNVFDLNNDGTLTQISNVPTRNGARTSLLIPELQLFVVPEPSVFTHDPELIIYKISK